MNLLRNQGPKVAYQVWMLISAALMSITFGYLTNLINDWIITSTIIFLAASMSYSAGYLYRKNKESYNANRSDEE